MPITIDFETLPIEDRPDFPPFPVSVSIKYPGQASVFLAWGHPSGNNTTYGAAKAELQKVWDSGDQVLCQNGKFDFDVAETHFGLPLLPWQRTEELSFLLYLDDPNQIHLGLKPSATRLLGWPADEQDAVKDWLVQNQPLSGIRITKGLSKKSKHGFAKYTAMAPAEVVGPYANGDTERTEALFLILMPHILERGMGAAYAVERRLQLVLLDMERQGVPVNLEALSLSVPMYREALEQAEEWIRQRINLPEDITLDSHDEVLLAMRLAGVVDQSLLHLTETGAFSASKESLVDAVTDKPLLSMMVYRNQLAKCLSTFLEPYLAMARASGGLIYTRWNQTAQSEQDGKKIGTRTGRLSSSPNLQNIPKAFKPLWSHQADGLPDDPLGLPPLPLVRSYVIAPQGYVLLDRDHSQQELRILAHYERGGLMRGYMKDAWLDLHTYVSDTLAERGVLSELSPAQRRSRVKGVNFGLLYGQGKARLAESIGTTEEEAVEIRDAVLGLYPGLTQLKYRLRDRARANLPVRTWGGREFYCEAPREYDWGVQTYEYKMLNTLIQGSAGDCLKHVILRFYETKKPSWRLLFNVHDQVTMLSPISEAQEAMRCLWEAMEHVTFNVAMLSEGKISFTNWAELQPYDKKGVICHEAFSQKQQAQE